MLSETEKNLELRTRTHFPRERVRVDASTRTSNRSVISHYLYERWTSLYISQLKVVILSHC